MIFKTYVLSLKDESQRREMISKQLDQLSIPFSIVEATDLRTQSDENIESFYSLDSSLKNINRSLTKGEIGCSLSHLSIYNDLLQSSANWALIIEDDAIISRFNLDELNELCQHNIVSDVVILGYSKLLLEEEKFYYWRFPLKKEIIFNNITLGRAYSQWSCGAVAYLINKNGARKMIEDFNQNAKKIVTVADDWNYFESRCNLKILHCRPIMVFEDFTRLESSLEKDRSIQNGRSIKRGKIILILQFLKGLYKRVLLYTRVN